MPPTEYGKALSGKTFRCGNVNANRQLKSLFVEGLIDWIKLAFQTNSGEKASADFHGFAAFTASTATLGRLGTSVPQPMDTHKAKWQQ